MSKQTTLARLGAPLALAAFLYGCSSAADKAITRLGGDKKDAEQAEVELTLMEPPPIDALSARLEREEDPKILLGAAQLLGRIAGKSKSNMALDGLLNCLKIERPATQAACAEGIGEAGMDKGYKALHALTLGKEESARQAAQEVLARKVSTIAIEAQEFAEDGEYEQAITMLEEALDFYPSSGDLITLLADANEAAGDAAKAEKWRAALATVKSWQVLAPLPPKTLKDLKGELPKSWQKPSEDQLEGLDGSLVGWQPMEATDANGYLSLAETYGVPQASAVLQTTFTVPPGGASHVLSLRMKERARVWVNGAHLYVSKGVLGDKWDEVRIPVTFRPGDNTVMIQLAQDNGLWGVAMRVLNADGSPVEGVEVKSP